MILNEKHKFQIRRYAILKYSIKYQHDSGERGIDFRKHPQSVGCYVLVHLTNEPEGMNTNWTLESDVISEADADELIQLAREYRDNILSRLAEIL